MFAETGAYIRAPGGNIEDVQAQRQVNSWMALNIGDDVGRDPSVWETYQRKAAGVMPYFPWLHCRNLEDIEWLISIGHRWRAQSSQTAHAIGLNIEDVFRDGISLADVAEILSDEWAGEVHVPTLPWVQNGQGWEKLAARCVFALEIFADEQQVLFPGGFPYQETIQECVDHAFSEGCTKVTLMLKTKGFSPSAYDLGTTHCFYTADDVGVPEAVKWPLWKDTRSPTVPSKPSGGPPMPPKPPLTEKQVPYTGPYSLPTGTHRSRGPTAKALKIAMKRMGEPPFAGKDNSRFDEHYNTPLEAALDATTNPAFNGYGSRRWEAVRALVVPVGLPAAGEYALNKEARDLILKDYAQMEQPELSPELLAVGPLWKGGKCVLDHAPTHSTTGIPLYPAFDDAFKTGTEIFAPEDLVISERDTSANPGEAVFADGASKLDYWIAHLDRDHPVGKKFAKGEFLGRVIFTTQGGGPHCHCGVNIERLFGADQQLLWGADGDGPNYTFGSPTIREQLEARMLV